ncbi:hypothetical protein [Paenibacillus cremeus]|uniref:Uncharacterized protein n=1 Tax=Paenibacillus cremeus TaxID=2163881 RepID=A0A559KHU7_9BACL|nr:hypothetical protein [Paenibacillus cremeus]TVY11658.1 hypothetical protein FPZ49_02850 [Paenibacillus cremeus]
MKIRLLPVLISVSVSAFLLFGGYFGYRSVAMENPMQKVVASIPGVDLVSMDLGGTDAVMELKLKDGTDLREVYNQILKDGSSTLGKKELKLKIVNSASPKLEQWWSSALFDVAQAMETKQYAQIPKTLQARADSTGAGVKVSTEMDDKYVYVTLTDGESSKYIMLPRIPATLGVWPNE